MTLGVAFIILIMLISVVVTLEGIMTNKEEVFAGGVILLIFTGIIVFGRYNVILQEELKKECISQGKQVIEIEDKSYCKL